MSFIKEKKVWMEIVEYEDGSKQTHIFAQTKEEANELFVQFEIARDQLLKKLTEINMLAKLDKTKK